MRFWRDELALDVPGRGLWEITDRVRACVRASGVVEGVAHLFALHTSCSLCIQENADPSVAADLLDFLARIAPDGAPEYRHRLEGPDDMPAHIRAMLTGVDLLVPVAGGDLVLGTWQGIYLAEHRTRPHRRRIVLSVWGRGQ